MPPVLPELPARKVLSVVVGHPVLLHFPAHLGAQVSPAPRVPPASQVLQAYRALLGRLVLQAFPAGQAALV